MDITKTDESTEEPAAAVDLSKNDNGEAECDNSDLL
jgi:hypothetical protein